MRLSSLVVVLCLALLVSFFVPWGSMNGKEATKGTACLSNLKQQAHALGQYATDHDGRYPPRDAWMDATRSYLKGPSHPEHCPVVFKSGGYGYAFNARLSTAREPARPEAVPLAYDSRNPIRNASDRVVSLPSKGRHSGKNNVAYADGHARREAP